MYEYLRRGRLGVRRLVLFQFFASPDGAHGAHLGSRNDVRLELVRSNHISAYFWLVLVHTTIRSQLQASTSRLQITTSLSRHLPKIIDCISEKMFHFILRITLAFLSRFVEFWYRWIG